LLLNLKLYLHFFLFLFKTAPTIDTMFKRQMSDLIDLPGRAERLTGGLVRATSDIYLNLLNICVQV
jgi:hypothetical protein